MSAHSSDDFFKDMGAGSPPPPARPKTTLARPPPPKIGTGTTATSKPPPAGMRPTGTTTARGTAGRTPSAGRTPTGTAARGTPTATGRGTSTAAGRGRTSGRTAAGGRTATGRTSAGRRPTTARGSRPTPAPVGGTGFYNPSNASSTTPSTHLGSSNNNPYAAGGSSNASVSSSDTWFSAPESQKDASTPNVMNPYASNNSSNTTSNNNFNQWQQPQQQPNTSQWQQPQQQPNTSQWQQPQQQPNNNFNQWQQQPPQQQQDQQLQALASIGGNFLMNSMMGNAGMAAATDANKAAAYSADDYDFENEPPLLEELGINIDHIRAKTLAVILPFQRVTGNVIHMEPSVIVEDADLAGPLLFALALGGELLMTGKLHFGYIYGFGLFGCMAVTLLLNLMSPQDPISIWTVASILGYGLLPVNILAAVKIIVVNIIRLETFGRILALLAIMWSTVASTRLLEVGCGLRHQRYLIGYPIALLYSAFVLMTIF